ncbi:uncharacterized [Tachysurus ichikawai]
MNAECRTFGLFFRLSRLFIFHASCAPSAVHVLFTAFARDLTRTHWNVPPSFSLAAFTPILMPKNQQTVLLPEDLRSDQQLVKKRTNARVILSLGSYYSNQAELSQTDKLYTIFITALFITPLNQPP